MGRACATRTNELLGQAQSKHGGDPQHDDAGSAEATSNPSHVQDAPGAGQGGVNPERVCGNAPGQIASGVPSRQGGIAKSGIASEA